MSYFQKLYENGELPHRAKLVYLYLHDRMDQERKAWPGIKTIAADLSLSRSTVKRAIWDSEKAPLIRTVKTAVRLPIAIIFSETEILRQGGGMPKRWTQPRSTVSLLEKPTLRGYGRKRQYGNLQILSCILRVGEI